MIAYVTSIGEATTDICVWQLKRFGFDVVLLGGKEDWIFKYRDFIQQAEMLDRDVLRVDADIIVNEKINTAVMIGIGQCATEEKITDKMELMVQFSVWDFYKNDISNSCPMYYSRKSLPIIRKNLDKLDKQRPECSASRLPEIHPGFYKVDTIVGMHGFFQDLDDQKRAYTSRERKHQLDEFDFELVNKIREL